MPQVRDKEGGGAWIVFDIGGTSVRAARFNPETTGLSSFVRCATPSHWTMPGSSTGEIQHLLINVIQGIVRDLAGALDPEVIAVAFPGPITADGAALSAPTVWGSGDRKPFAVRDELQSLWPRARVVVVNDVTAAGYRYFRTLDDDFCIVTVSSGVGLKVFINGRPMLGRSGRGGEIGHVRVDFSQGAPLCDCGGQGHLGAIASGRGALLAARRLANHANGEFDHSCLRQRFGSDLAALSNEAIVEAFNRRDPWTVWLIRNVAQPLGQMLATIHVALGIERFVIVGGFAIALGDHYRLNLAAAARQSCWDLGQDWEAMISLGEPDDLSGLIGAGRCALFGLETETVCE